MASKQKFPGGDPIEEMFRAEVEAQCAAMTESLLALERGDFNPAVMQSLMRAAHSLKGAARIVNRRSIERIAHAMEDCFVLTQHGTIWLGREDITVLLTTVDFLLRAGMSEAAEPEDVQAMHLAAHLSALEKISLRAHSESSERRRQSAAPAPQSEPPQNPHGSDPRRGMAIVHARDRFLRVTTESLNRLLGLAGDSLVESRWLQSHMENARKLGKERAEVDRLAQSVGAILAQANVPEKVRSRVENLTRKLAVSQEHLRQGIDALEAHDRRVAQVSHRLYMEVLRTRMRPFSDISSAFPRMVRDLAVTLGKEVRFEVTGESTQVDREVLASIETAIAHLLRNAVDHGCETPKERERAGKPVECSVRLDARQSSGMLVVTVTDDGAGVDPTVLRKEAARLSPSNHKNATDKELLDLLLIPGFTLKQELSEISGRGIGLDLVHNTARRLRGTIRVENEYGHGMKFTLQLPLTISVVRALVVEIGGEPYAIPMSQIDRVLRVSASEVVLIQGKRHLPLGKEHVRLAGGRDLLCHSPVSEAVLNIVILGEKKGRAALGVDAFLGERELIIQPLDIRLGKVPDVSSASVMDDGAPVLVFDPEELAHSILAHKGA